MILVFSLFSSLTFASNSAVKLKTIKPVHNSNLELGQLNVNLISVLDGETVATLSGKLGDCVECIRGASVDDNIGIRLVGSTPESLKLARKQTTKIKIAACPQGAKLLDYEVSCDFVLDKKPMKMVFRLSR